jgi:hypothetical protein
MASWNKAVRSLSAVPKRPSESFFVTRRVMVMGGCEVRWRWRFAGDVRRCDTHHHGADDARGSITDASSH